MLQSSPPLVCTLVYDHLCTFEYGIATELFALQRNEISKPLYRFETIAAESGALCAVGGLQIKAHGGIERLNEADIIIIPGWRSISSVPNAELVQALQNASKRGATILSICSGVFVLAHSGLLDGKRATTHWRYIEQLAEQFPDIQIDANVLYVDEGDILTSAGSAAGIDLCLHVIRRQYGQEITNKIARSLILPAVRDGGQAQYAPRPIPQCRDKQFGFLLDELRADLKRQWNIESIAKLANLATRTLLRRFKSYTGESPITWLINERLRFAGELLETTSLNIDLVSHNAGFSAPEIFRQHFKKMYQISPSRYRGQFKASTAKAL